MRKEIIKRYYNSNYVKFILIFNLHFLAVYSTLSLILFLKTRIIGPLILFHLDSVFAHFFLIYLELRSSSIKFAFFLDKLLLFVLILALFGVSLGLLLPSKIKEVWEEFFPSESPALEFLIRWRAIFVSLYLVMVLFYAMKMGLTKDERFQVKKELKFYENFDEEEVRIELLSKNPPIN